MDLEMENRIAAILMKEAAELRRQAEKDGVTAYMRQPNVRGRPNSRFLTATVLGIQQANRAVEVIEMWRVRQKEQELDNRLKRRQRDESNTYRSYRGHEVGDRLKRKPSDDSSSDGSYRDTFVDDRLKRRDKSSSFRSYKDTEDVWRSTNKRHDDGGRTSDFYSSSERSKQEYHLDEGPKDAEIAHFLSSRVKRGRGAVGSRMDEAGPYLPPCSDSNGKQLLIIDVAAREERNHKFILGPEKPPELVSWDSSEEGSFQERHEMNTKAKNSSSKHTRKEKTKEKSKDNRKRTEEERQHKRHK